MTFLLGYATGTLTINSKPIVTEVSPTVGSVGGGTLITIRGNGFIEDEMKVIIGETDCEIKHWAVNKVRVLVYHISHTYTPHYTCTSTSTHTDIRIYIYHTGLRCASYNRVSCCCILLFLS